MKEDFKRSVENIAKHGDTDIFPFPVENHVFYDKPEAAYDLLCQMNKNFEEYLLKYPPIHENALATAGYIGFRWATQIDPFWNAYLLGLVISLGPDIEKKRIPVERRNIFSYRFLYDEHEKLIFDRNIGWIQFQQTSVEMAPEFSHVLMCDISDFYPRIYHHRLENALKKASTNTENIRRIKLLLFKLSKGVSYGLK